MIQPATSRVRFRVLGFCVALAAITYMDRIAIANMAKYISRDLSLSDTQMSYVFSAFTLAYGLFEIPTGWWGDRVGTRRVLMRIVTWWSTFTIATAFVFSFPSLLITRFLFGLGEAGAWPNAAKTFSKWIPVRERGTAQGIFFMGAHFGAAYSPLLIQYLLTFLDWQACWPLPEPWPLRQRSGNRLPRRKPSRPPRGKPSEFRASLNLPVRRRDPTTGAK